MCLYTFIHCMICMCLFHKVLFLLSTIFLYIINFLEIFYSAFGKILSHNTLWIFFVIVVGTRCSIFVSLGIMQYLRSKKIERIIWYFLLYAASNLSIMRIYMCENAIEMSFKHPKYYRRNCSFKDFFNVYVSRLLMS